MIGCCEHQPLPRPMQDACGEPAWSPHAEASLVEPVDPVDQALFEERDRVSKVYGPIFEQISCQLSFWRTFAVCSALSHAVWVVWLVW